MSDTRPHPPENDPQAAPAAPDAETLRQLLADAEAALEAARQEAARYRTFAELSSAYCYELQVRPDGAIVLHWYDPRFEQLTGYTQAELAQPEGWLTPIHEADRLLVAEHIRQVVAGHEHCVDLRIAAKCGAQRTLRTCSAPVFAADGHTVVAVRGTAQDITAQDAVRSSLAREALDQHALMQQAASAIFVTDAQGYFLDVNAQAAHLTGYSREDLCRMHLTDLIDPEDLERRPVNYDRLRSGAVIVRERPLLRRDGSRFISEITVRGLEDGRTHSVVRDVTARKQTERALREREQRFRAVFQSAFQYVALLAPDGTLLEVNQKALAFSEARAEEVVGRPFWAGPWWAHSAELQALVTTAIAQAAAGEPFTAEVPVPHHSGAVVLIDFLLRPLFDDDGKVLYLVAEGQDVTEARRVQAALESSERRHRTLVAHAPDAIVILDAHTGRFAEANPEAERLFGLSRDALLRIGPGAVSPPFQPDGRPSEQAARAFIGAALEGQTPSFTWTHRNVSGQDIPCEVRLVRLPHPTQALVRGSITDVSERQLVEKALRIGEERYQSLMAHASDAIYLMEFHRPVDTRLPLAEQVETIYRDAYVADCNEQFVRLYGREAREQVLGTSAFRLQTPREADRSKAFLRQWVEAGYQLEEYVTEARHADGRRLVVRTNCVGIVEDGFLVRLWATQQDITERRRAEQQLRQAKETAETMNRLKSAFLTNMSHEFRTPLTSIIGFASILAEEERLDPEHAEMLELIEHSGIRLLTTLNGVLDLALLDSGNIEVAPSLVDLCAETRAVVDVYDRDTTAKQVSLAFECVDGPLYNCLDIVSYRRILHHLMSNAVKFTDGGMISVRLHHTEQHTILEVQDTGVGISEDFLPHAFDEFTQESAGIARHYEGTGLGLAVARGLTELMEGELLLASDKGKGTTVTLRLPRRSGLRMAVA